MIPAVENHLWQSTVFACVVALLTLALRNNRAAVRHRLWLAASLKFLIPFSVLIGLGADLGRRDAAVPKQAQTPSVTAAVAQPFATHVSSPLLAAVPEVPSRTPAILLCVWLCGFAASGLVWWRRWRRIRAAVRAASPLPLGLPIRALSSPARLEPGVFGIFRPVLLLPQGIVERLTPEQLQPILAHELCHVRRRDNLTAAIHMLTAAIFWFHPLLWWIGARLVEERERACDEEVLGTVADPQDYAEGILNVCKFYVESRLACVPGVTGANLKKRVEAIMENRVPFELNAAKKAALAVTAGAAVVLPVLLGLISAPAIRAQSAASAVAEFDVATVKRSPPPNGQLIDINLGTVRNGMVTLTNVTLNECVKFAYGIVSDAQISGPDWANAREVSFDIVAKASPDTDREKLLLMTQKLLSERLKLALHHEQKPLPHLALVVGKNGTKLHQAPGTGGNTANAGHITGSHMPMPMLAMLLSRFQRQTIVDMTGLQGSYAVKLDWAVEDNRRTAPGGAATLDVPEGPSIYTAVQEQLGLRLESQKGPIDVLVIDHAEQTPIDN